MAKPTIITGIDLGTDKCATLISSLDPETNNLQVLGVSAVPSQGIRKSQIVDLEKVVNTLTQSVDAAERMAGLEIKNAYFSISGSHISSQNSKGVVAVASPNQEIVPEDVARVIEAARAISLPADKEILHVIPHDFTVDAQEGIKDPVGMTGIRLETQAHIVTGMTTAIRNLTKCAHDIGLEINGFVFSGLAAAEVTLTETEKELGVLLVDIGAGSTSVCAFVEGALTFSRVYPIGARHITQDIALGCRISLDNAEKIKIALSRNDLSNLKLKSGETKEEFRKRKKQEDTIDLEKLGINESIESISKRTLVDGIMVPRIKEIFTLIGKDLQQKNLFPSIPAGLVISGGGGDTIEIAEVAKRTLNLPARIGIPEQLAGLVEDIHKPAFATSIGLLKFGQNHQKRTDEPGFDFSGAFKNFNFKHLFGQVIKFIKSLLP